MYACGLTVYSQPHIGNWVTYIYWDTLVRTLRGSDYTVENVQNITDVGHLTSDEDAGEDKMLKGALREGLTAWQVAQKYMDIAEHEAYELLQLTRPTHMPRATEYISQQSAFVEELDKKGYVYTIEDGIYFDTSKLKNYGQLARLDIDGLQFGARVADTGKKNPTDFAVWKFSNPSEKRDMEWDSPLGNKQKGFPGWHLECSVMARELLGDQIDIHTGGIDHIPVHHTNEIAQTEAVTEQPFSQFWVHANHLKVNGTKISKSLGNSYNLQDITDKGYDLQAFKLLVLSKHYRTEGNFTWEILEAAQNRLRRWQAAADMLWQSNMANPDQEPLNAQQYAERILGALQDDLNTPTAISTIDEAIDHVEQGSFSPKTLEVLFAAIKTYLGIDLLAGKTDISDTQKELLTQRQTARDNKDWAASDEIRDQLLADNIAVRDTSTGQIWTRHNPAA
jgi:cysteinyl-tRNA synthetase